MEIKKAYKCANVFDLQQVVVQNMRQLYKICMSHKDMFQKVILLSVILLLNMTMAYADIEPAAQKMYYKLVIIGKWVIIFKGGIDIIQSIISGDAQSAKKMFLGYLFAYAVLWALPWCMDEVESVFGEM